MPIADNRCYKELSDSSVFSNWL